ncbi:hypothetical protein BN7_6225 [Wickerhamomyces ciferrii]|uniref:Uncharacterized protein n=1 Tax=Wickerhamomyces ciferrii (strain ATCC 14091 / BCRC 22168 / CBS 111 / JCM 3599 / NBRC 0793 / NRRL Y-1031 F-60-10) TaxID=1206466 RepID=K0KMX8_WICCF|nr:uncharacterized protein BN7_6225 [Wickerhamomyces ciferrii]CCH46630.1 hypothetical protein BN7_6225 [Wickerhamomyces ciferrii]
MMNRPSRTTVIFNNIPENWLVGIDLQFFNTNNILKGIKLIPDGIHILHFAKDQSSIRQGFYINAKEGDIILVYWDSQEEKILVDEEIGEININKELSKISEYYSFMINYPNDEHWEALTKYINIGQVAFILPKGKKIDSVLTSSDENNLLLDTLYKSSKSRNLSQDPIINSIIDQSNEEIKYTMINLDQTIRPNGNSIEKTKDSLDKSWFFQKILNSGFNDNENLLLSEFQQCYLNMIIFANYSSSIQWLKFLKILFNVKESIQERLNFFENFLDVLTIQFEKFQEDYIDEFINEEFLDKSISEFEYTVKEFEIRSLIKKIINLKNLLSLKFGIHITGFVEDDDEEAPVIVDI